MKELIIDLTAAMIASIISTMIMATKARTNTMTNQMRAANAPTKNHAPDPKAFSTAEIVDLNVSAQPAAASVFTSPHASKCDFGSGVDVIQGILLLHWQGTNRQLAILSSKSYASFS